MRVPGFGPVITACMDPRAFEFCQKLHSLAVRAKMMHFCIPPNKKSPFPKQGNKMVVRCLSLKGAKALIRRAACLQQYLDNSYMKCIQQKPGLLYEGLRHGERDEGISCLEVALDCIVHMSTSGIDTLVTDIDTIYLKNPFEYFSAKYARTHALTHKQTHKQTHAQTDARTHARTNRRTHAWTHARVGARTHGRVDARAYVAFGRTEMHTRTHHRTIAPSRARMDARTHTWRADGRMHRLKDGRTDARTHACTHARTHARTHVRVRTDEQPDGRRMAGRTDRRTDTRTHERTDEWTHEHMDAPTHRRTGARPPACPPAHPQARTHVHMHAHLHGEMHA